MVGVRERPVSAATTPPRTEVLIPPQWAAAADSIALDAFSGPPATLICGPKNSGKSTFSRYLLNVLLPRYRKVFYLDTDVGQPEFGVPGCLSLHAIDECIQDLANPCIKKPERSYFFGDISSKRDPKAYLDYTFLLYDCYLKEHYHSNERNTHGKSVFPLIINTPGWVKGTGFDLLVEMLTYTTPANVVQLRISAESKNLPVGIFWLHGDQEKPVNLINISSARKDSFRRSLLTQKDARGMRDQRLFNYFKQCFPEDLNIISNKDLARALSAIPPYEVPYSRVKVVHLHCKVPTIEIFHSLNATIVGLAVTAGGATTSQCHPPCLGLGIIRSIDLVKGVVYIITPVSRQDLHLVNLLLQGFIEIPTGLLQVRGCLSPYMMTKVLHKPHGQGFIFLSSALYDSVILFSSPDPVTLESIKKDML